MALGRAIVRQLELDRSGEVLAKWMAHHLAEVIRTAETNEGMAKQDAEDRAVELILKLWTNRRALPDPADPLRGYSDAIEVLAGMLPSADPWRRFRRTGSDDELLHDMFGAMVQLIMSGLILTRAGKMRMLEDVERDALSEEEAFLVEVLDRWHRFFVTPAPSKIELELLCADLLTGKTGAEERPTAELQHDEEMGPDPSVAHRAAILSHVETFQARLGDLLEQWRRKTMPDNDMGDTADPEDDEG